MPVAFQWLRRFYVSMPSAFLEESRHGTIVLRFCFYLFSKFNSLMFNVFC